MRADFREPPFHAIGRIKARRGAGALCLGPSIDFGDLGTAKRGE
jgi:hypothetical protein